MPIFMDRHDLSGGVTAKDVALVHQQDLSIQDQFGCRGLTYWFDEERGAAFCLIEAPTQDSVKEMHDHAHGLIPHKIIEVESNVVEAFLGRIHDPKPDNNVDESGLLILNDPAFRAIMSVDLEESALIDYRLGPVQSGLFHQTYSQIIQKALDQFKGRKVEHVRDGFLVSFVSVSNAMCSALEIQSSINKLTSKFKVKLEVQIGLSAGVPVTSNNAFFGETISQANILCEFSHEGQILISSFLKEYLSGENQKQLDNQASLKVLKPEEEDFLKQLKGVIEELSINPESTIDLINKRMGMSKSKMYRKSIALTGFSPNDLIKEFRLKRSLKRLGESHTNISEVAYESGFSSLSYFSKCFQKKYNITPSEFLRTREI